MTVDDEEQRVSRGDLVYVPPHSEHKIRNTGDDVLQYISAATPAFDMSDVEEFYEE